jgi:hypothetical protein
MATLLLSAAVANGSIGLSYLGSILAFTATSYIDQRLFGQKIHQEGSRLQDLRLQTSTYGVTIPKVYGTARVAGNIIWGTNFVEHANTSEQGGKGGGGGSVSTTEYTYSVSFAVSLGKGPITGINRVWTDGKPFPLYESKYTVSSSNGDVNTLTFTAVAADADSTWTLTTKDVGGVQMLGVVSGGITYADCAFGALYDNGLISFLVDYKTTSTAIANGTIFTLDVEPSAAKFTYNLHLGTEVQTADSIMEAVEGVGNVPAYRGMAYIVFQDMYLGDFGNRPPNLNFEVTTATTSLQTIVENISTESGIAAADVDATDLAGLTVTGYSIESVSSGRNKIEPLMTVFNFDGVERDGKVYFLRRTTSGAISIPYEDLGAHESESVEPLTITIADELEMPRSVSVQYVSSDFDYQTQSMQSRRQLSNSKNETNISVPIVMTDAQAQALAEKLLYEAWINRTGYETVLGPKYADVTPGKVLSITDDEDNIHTCVVTNSNYGKPGINKISAIAIDAVTYASANRTPDSNIVPGDGSAATQVYIEFLDLPKLPDDTSATDNIYIAATGQVYQGVDVYTSADGGSTYTLLKQHLKQATMGYTLTELGAGTEYIFDNKNTVDVVVLNGTLSSRPKIDVLNGYNAAVIGSEIIGFTTATLLSTNTYRLSGLLRGRLGTEDQITEHTAGDRFVLLESGAIGTIPSASWYVARTYRCGPAGVTVSDLRFINESFTNQARLNQPWSVCHVAGTRDVSSNLTITWVRRTRYGGEWQDLADVPLNETSESYQIDVMNGATVVRTITATSQTASYSAADQTTDFGAPQPSLTVRIYQMSETRGRGIREEATI